MTEAKLAEHEMACVSLGLRKTWRLFQFQRVLFAFLKSAELEAYEHTAAKIWGTLPISGEHLSNHLNLNQYSGSESYFDGCTARGICGKVFFPKRV
jgi:hypothetical protein